MGRLLNSPGTRSEPHSKGEQGSRPVVEADTSPNPETLAIRSLGPIGALGIEIVLEPKTKIPIETELAAFIQLDLSARAGPALNRIDSKTRPLENPVQNMVCQAGKISNPLVFPAVSFTNVAPPDSCLTFRGVAGLCGLACHALSAFANEQGDR